MRTLYLTLFNLILFTLFAAVVEADTCTNAAKTGVYPCSITLTWVDNSNNESEFNIEKQLNGGAWNFMAKTAPNVITFTDNLLQQSAVVDNVYCYRVKAANMSAGTPPVLQESTPSNTACYTISKLVVPVPPPSGPTGLTISFNNATGQLQLGKNRTVNFKDQNGTFKITGPDIVVMDIVQ
jgi:hypothetical protein